MPLENFEDCIKMLTCTKATPKCHLNECADCPKSQVIKDHLTVCLDSSDIDNVECYM